MKWKDFYEERGLDRIIGLSDGVFAFSITLLAADLVVPELKQAEMTLLYQDLAGEIPRFLCFVFAFIITSIYWISHHGVFRFIKRYDDLLMRLNLAFLLCVTLMPFITKLINEYGHLQIVVILAAIGYGTPGLIISIIWHYASQNYRLIDETVQPEFIRLIMIKNYASPLVFAASIPISFISPLYATRCWLLLFPIKIIEGYLFRKIIDKD